MIQTKIKEEAEKYGDIVQGAFTDTYRNRTLKVVLGLKLAAEVRKLARLLIKVDDDALVNIFKRYDLLK